MPSLDETNGLRHAVASITGMALRDLAAVVRFAPNVPLDQRQQFTVSALMDLLQPAAAAVAALTGEFYLNDRAAVGVTDPPPAVPRYSLDPARVQALAGWALQPLGIDNEPDLAAALSRATGGGTRLMYNPQRQTIYDMAAEEPHQVRYQRMAQPGCCAFCAMLASRGAVYTSEAAASQVVGRGVPIPRKKRRGGQAGGVRTRGTRGMGSQYHDDCRCVGVAVHEGRAVQMDAAAAKWRDIYEAASKKAHGKLTRNVTEVLVPETHTVNGQQVTRNRRKKVYSWINEDEASAQYGEETTGYGVVQAKILAEMRRLAAEQDLAMA